MRFLRAYPDSDSRDVTVWGRVRIVALLSVRRWNLFSCHVQLPRETAQSSLPARVRSASLVQRVSDRCHSKSLERFAKRDLIALDVQDTKFPEPPGLADGRALNVGAPLL